MGTEEQRLAFINSTTNYIHDACDSLYEALMDMEYDVIDEITRDMLEVIRDLNETFTDRI